eukprot:TRINITY_DN7036_c0_g1_i7.p1 TRINITY_DN7036_c0_g1~~TRINITY_DN7036_c0_g1_i7.p1  ORF type:complete len:1022 (+),score=237.43 TRINITY_DN7036_c0_g1_i7:67-3132(+)
MEWEKPLQKHTHRSDREYASQSKSAPETPRDRLPNVAGFHLNGSLNGSHRKPMTFTFSVPTESDSLLEQVRQLKYNCARLKEDKLKLQSRINKMESDHKRGIRDTSPPKDMAVLEIVSLSDGGRPKTRQTPRSQCGSSLRYDTPQESVAVRLSDILQIDGMVKDLRKSLETQQFPAKDHLLKSIYSLSHKMDEIMTTSRGYASAPASLAPTPPPVPKSPTTTQTTPEDRVGPITNPVLAARRVQASPRKASIVIKTRSSMVHALQSTNQLQIPQLRRALSKTETKVELYSTLVAFLIDKKSKLNSICLDTISWDEFSDWVEKQPEEEHENIVRELFYMMKSYRKVMDISTQISFSMTVDEVIARFSNGLKEILVSEVVHFYMITHPTELMLYSFDKQQQKLVPKGEGIIGYVAESGTMINLSNPQSSGHYNAIHDKPDGLNLTCLMAIPMYDRENQVFGVAVAYNKVTGFFVKEDEVVMESLVHQASNSIQQFQLLIRATWEQQKTKSLLEVIKVTKNEKSTLEEMIAKTVEVTYSALRVQLVSFYLVDNINKQLVLKSGKDKELTRKEIGDDITGIVAKSGKTLNIANGEKDQRCLKLSQQYDIKIRTILSMPICDSTGSTVAVIEVINKDQDSFNRNDEEILSAFLVEVASVIQRKSLETAYMDLMGSSQDSTTASSLKDLIGEYSTFKNEGVDLRINNPHIVSLSGPSLSAQGLKDWSLDHFGYTEDEMIGMIIAGFEALDLLSLYSIDEAILRKFICTVYSNYQQNPYHNFIHAFSVFHCAFMILTTTELPEYLTSLDILALMIAALCHDLDHPGTNNAYQINSQSQLALVYNDQSVLENHHASLTFRILNDPSTNIIAHLDSSERTELRRIVISAILATDMSHHSNLTTQLTVHDGAFQRDSKDDRMFLVNIVLHSSDLCNPILPTPIAYRWASCVLKEFNDQALKEKEQSLPVASFMEKGDEISKANLNLNFIKYVVNPLWTRLAQLFPSLRRCLDQMEANIASWEKILTHDHSS